MDKTRFRFVVVLLIFVVALVIVRLEGNGKFLETLFANKVMWVSPDEPDQESVEEKWTHCWKKIDHSSKSIPKFRLNLPSDVEKAIDNLHPKAQESLLDCLTRENLLLDIRNNNHVSITWLEEFLDYLSGISSVPRRILRSRRRHKKSKTDDLALHEKHPDKSHEQESEDLPLTKKSQKSHKQDTDDSTLRKKLPDQSHEQKDDDLAISEKRPNKPQKPKEDDLAPHKKHSHQHHEPEATTLPTHKDPESASISLPEKLPDQSHKRKDDLSVSEKHPDETHKPKPDDLVAHKKHSHQDHEPEATNRTIRKDPESTSITPPALTKSLASAPSRTPSPAQTHITSTLPKLDTSPPPLVAKPSPIQAAPDTARVKSEDGTHRYMIIALVAGAVALLALLVLLLACCLKRGKNKVDPEEGLKVEKPLHSIGMSNISGAAEKSQCEENPNEQLSNTPTLSNNPTLDNESSPRKSLESSQSQTNAPLLVPPPPAKKSQPPPSAPPPPLPKKPSAPPPPPPKGAKAPPAPLGKPLINNRGKKPSLGGVNNDNGGSDSSNKAKLKPFFWDKVSPDQSMVWQDLKAGSFQVDEAMMETLFGYTVAENTTSAERKSPTPYNSPSQFIKIIDPKKAQNLSILLKALNVTTEEVCDALKEGNELPSELIQNLTKMTPTTEEELKLRLYNGELSMLGPSERFLKSVVEIPFAFKRLESLLFMSSVQDEVSSINDSFKTLEVACTELKNSRLFLKLLEAVLKTGNRMNDGTYRGDAQAFKLDTLLKLSDVKGTDGKTTLLHFVVQEIIRSEGIRAARKLRESQSMSSLTPEDLNDDNVLDSVEYLRSLGLNGVSNLSSDLENVRKAALIDGDAVTNAVYKLGTSLGKIKNFMESEMKGLEEECEFRKKLEDFVISTEDEIKRLVEEEKRIMELVKGTVDYFYGKGGKNEGLRLFVIVADFLVMLEKVCKEVRNKEKTTPVRVQRREALSPSTSSDSTMSVETNDIRKKLFPVITATRMDGSISDDESFSP